MVEPAGAVTVTVTNSLHSRLRLSFIVGGLGGGSRVESGMLVLIRRSRHADRIAEAFPGGRLVFDAANQRAVRLMLKTWIKTAEIRDVGAYFAVSDAKKEFSGWSPRLRVSSRGYMLGYQSLDDASVPGFYRFLAKVGDGMMRMQIVRLEFAEGEKHV